jgi:hypothetical protein
MDNARMKLIVESRMCKIETPAPKSNMITRILQLYGLSRISKLTLPKMLNACATTPISISVLHHHMGHISHTAVQHTVNSGLVTGVEIDLKSAPSFCETCVRAKINRLPFPNELSTWATVYGERVWSDVWGPAPIKSLGHKSYMLTFTNEASYETVEYFEFISRKSDVFENYKNYEAWVKKHRNKDGIKNLCNDCTGDYLSKEFVAHLKSQGTHHEPIVHDPPPQNGMVEVTNHIITVLGCSLLIGNGLSRFLWKEAFHYVAWIKFCSPHSALSGTTLYEFVHKKKPNLQNLHKFSVTVYVKDLTMGKLDIQGDLSNMMMRVRNI